MKKYHTNIQPDGILAFKGPDSRKFLQGQTTCDIDLLTAANPLYGAFCNPKGRVKTTFLLVEESEDNLLMLLRKDQCDYLRDELKMYIAFFKSEIHDLSDQFQIFGMLSPSESSAEQKEFTASRDGDLIQVQLPGSPSRDLLIAPKDHQPTENYETSTDNGWLLSDIRNGMVWTTAANREQFLPHDINLPGLGGVSYTKGCYTGQEIVARMHYRGNPKYTTAVLTTSEQNVTFESPLRVVQESDKLKTIGHAVTEAVDDDGKSVILVSILKDFLNQQELVLSNPEERTILCKIYKPFIG